LKKAVLLTEISFAMVQKPVLLLLVVIQLFTGCSLLKLHPDPPAEGDIKVTWEETGKDQIVVSYTSNRKPKQEKKQDAREPDVPTTIPERLALDTVSTAYASLLAEINTWMGTPYGYSRSEKGKGTDCSGMVMEVYLTVYGVQLNRSSDGQVANTTPVRKEELQIGDLVFFVTRGSRISHVGIYIGNNKFAHSTTQRGVIISDLDERYYKDRYVRSGRVIR
jgi:cell wall-associated NlpC family hydrolase